MADNHSLAAKLLIVSGKLSGLDGSLCFYETPTGEKVNSRLLVAYLMAATIEDMKGRGLLDYELGEMKAIGGKIPLLVLTKKTDSGVGFEKIILDKLVKPTNLIDLVKSIIGGMYELPEYRILYFIRSEFDMKEFMRQETVKMMIFFSRQETRWIPEKVQPLVDQWLPELKPVWEKTMALPWLKTAVRNCNFGFSTSKAQERDDD
jgi:hypothetical protein